LRKLLIVIGLLVLLPLLSGCDTLPSEKLPVTPGHLVMERMMLPAQFKKSNGSYYMANLDALVIRPDDNQAHPLAVINHGFEPINYGAVSVDEFQERAMEFARRGWVTVVFTRRGYGRSGGWFIEGARDLGKFSLIRAGETPAEDICEAIRLMAKKSYVDPSRVISVGISGGGYASIALTANPPPGLVAAINFAGGMGIADAASVPRFNESLTKAVATFGKTSRIPMLWIYAENDRTASPALARQLFSAFVGAGANAEFIAAPNFASYKNDGHYLFRYGIPVWTPYVDTFLQKQGLKLMDGLISVSNVRTVQENNKQ